MKAVIFDFDGTIADSFPIALEIFYELTGHERLPSKEIDRLREMTILELSKELRIPIARLPFLLVRGKKLLKHRMDKIEVFPGVDKVIKTTSEEYKLFILSSNTENNIESFLKRYGLSDCFTAIYGNAGIFSKAKMLKKIVRSNSLVLASTWYVGDEARDIEAAHRAGLKSIAVSWGYNANKVLKEHEPDLLVYNNSQLLRCITNN